MTLISCPAGSPSPNRYGSVMTNRLARWWLTRASRFQVCFCCHNMGRQKTPSATSTVKPSSRFSGTILTPYVLVRTMLNPAVAD